MKKLVIDVAASEGGALSILREFYNTFATDLENNYIICTGTIHLDNTSNIEVLSFPWVKKSWLHRLWFEYIVAPKLVEEKQIDEVFSLQNTMIPCKGCVRTLYVHNSLPFTQYKFELLNEPMLWMYQNVIARFIISSIKQSDRVIVQSRWMKNAIEKRCSISSGKVIVQPPQNIVMPHRKFSFDRWKNSFIYPASNVKFKNHIVVFKAAKLLKEQGINNFNIHLTLNREDMPKDCEDIYPYVEENISLDGKIPHDELMEKYAENILLFPSYVETYGLPMLEARMCGTPIIASDMPFAHEILDSYEDVSFFKYDDAEQLSTLINGFL